MASVIGSFINLDKSAKRHKACSAEIESADLAEKYQRFPGVDGSLVGNLFPKSSRTPGKLGCWLSHLAVMEQSLAHDHHQHFLEDDFVFTTIFKSFIDHFGDHTSGLGDWDVIFCDFDLAGMDNVVLMDNLIRLVSGLEKSSKIAFEDAVKIYAGSTSSYIVNRTSKKRIYRLMAEGFESGLPNDLYLRKLIREGKVKAFVTLPFVTTVSDDFSDSTILGDISRVNPSIMFATLFRQSLAWGADTERLLSDFRRRINQLAPTSDRGLIYAEWVAHFVSDEYQAY